MSVPRILSEVGIWKGDKRFLREVLYVLVVCFDSITEFVFTLSGFVSLVEILLVGSCLREETRGIEYLVVCGDEFLT